MNQNLDLRNLSPVLGKPVKKLEQIQTLNKNKLNLEDVHRHLHQHLIKKVIIPRPELKMYFDQVKRMNPDEQTINNRRLLMKVRGLLNYILKRRSDFQCLIVKGEITIFEKSASEEVKSVNEMPEPPKFYSQPSEDSFKLGSSFLTNNDFLTVTSDQNLQKMEVESTYNYSTDLFPDTIESLHNFSQENYQMLKCLTNKSSSEDDQVFKVPPPPLVADLEKPYKIDKHSGDLFFEKAISLQDFSQTSDHEENFADNAYKMHDVAEENYNSLFSETPSLSQICEEEEGAAADTQMGELQGSFFDNDNLFDDLSITNDQLKEEFDMAHEQMEEWLSELAHDLIHLEVNESYTIFNPAVAINENNETSKMNESVATSSSIPVSPYYSEENLKIIREVCSEFKKDLEERMKTDKSLEILRDLLNSSDM
ncbi:uncharacterized protein LOC135144570 [Zophobas morio]|uniref:uncharacterized protein LOC135144570 n=1 Tax=Zophobas morio TaxID=2755281 RepID=UPI0030833E9C